MSTSTLSEIVESWGGLIQTGPFGSQLHQHDYSEEGIPVVMPKDIRNGRIDESGIARIPEGKASQLARHFLKAGSVVFPRRGEISKCAYIDEEQAGFLCGTGCIKIEPPEEKLRSKFLFYFLGLRQSVEWLERNAVGTTMLNLNTKILGGLKVPLFAPKKQDEIVEILSTYDDLIENNRRRIQLLEQAARLLYKEWFVHLRFPGHEHTQIIDGVPEGWERTTIAESASFISRGITPKYDDDAPGIVINQKCIRNRMVGLDFARRQSKQVPPAKIVQFGDVLINSTGAGTLGRVAQLLFEIEECTVDSHVTIVRPKEGVPVYYFGLHLTGLESYVATLGRGATNQTELSKDDIAAIEIVLPSSGSAQIFESIVAPSFRQIRVLSEQIERLIKARDLLLPKLMNGEVAV